MQKLIDSKFLEIQALALKDWLLAEILVLNTLGQVIFILLAFFAAYLARKQSMSLITWLTHWRGADNWLTKAGDTLCPLTLPLPGCLFSTCLD